ncbi:hypothetical protein M0D21_18805 [Aquimarina sp. D1M17]|uniref:hypothetical protein n=1 Tax=Aquimarina acroporae TaxID=2937283 RepID=UPI0020BE4590|nr:hypothetical protein [Aquimarina acroporae]MCK8523641.1 hypothetical protein [Aquimarina acroporae]
MKNQILKTVLLTILILLSSCSNDDDATLEIAGITSFEKEGQWNCELSESCEDIYQFEFKKGSKIAISIEDVTGMSAVSLDLSAEFGQFGGPNLLNEGQLSYYGCSGQDENISITNISISETSTYNLSIARDWGLSAGVEGTYKVTIISDTAFTEGVSAIEDVKTENYERECL